MAFELRQQRRGAPALRGEEAHEDLVAQRRRPSGSAREPGCERPLAARREPEETSDAGAEWLVATDDETAALELMKQLVHLADVRVPERSEALIEELQQPVAVGFSLGEQREQRVAQVHALFPPGRRAARRVPSATPALSEDQAARPSRPVHAIPVPDRSLTSLGVVLRSHWRRRSAV